MPSHPFKRPRDWKNSRFLRYRSKDRREKTSKSDSSSTSESGLSEFFGATSISRETSGSDQSQALLQPRPQPSRYYQREQPPPQQPQEPEELPFDSRQDYILGSPFGSFNLPFEPVYRAGILIVVTSPEGKLSMGLCDDDKRSGRPTQRYYQRRY